MYHYVRAEAGIWNAVYHRQQALLCRGLAGSCLHHGTREALLEMAAQHDAKADRLEAEAANKPTRRRDDGRDP